MGGVKRSRSDEPASRPTASKIPPKSPSKKTGAQRGDRGGSAGDEDCKEKTGRDGGVRSRRIPRTRRRCHPDSARPANPAQQPVARSGRDPKKRRSQQFRTSIILQGNARDPSLPLHRWIRQNARFALPEPSAKCFASADSNETESRSATFLLASMCGNKRQPR